MNDTWWYLARASGIVATVLIVASLVWGFLFSARETGKRYRPAWWLDLHNWLGGLALVFTAVHVVAVFADSDLGIGLLQILVPGTASRAATAMSFGVIGLYLLTVVVFTSWPKKRFARRTWRIVHLLSVPATVVAILHGYQAGSDRDATAFELGLIALVAVAVYPAALRAIGVITARRAAAGQR